ncbi:Protein phosphatase 1 regulatory inhibitor subunit PPP1R7-like protein [Frankliniella fusca]|uniref:Protein phosphatase 1 regulatory inhibitor subunit PPP1R7-like protein n=1 Tax=Frankliniella fusca TaxID=407009 RepID=A0AAE1GTH3_9NEOP|nr:Protein phosphatase 1 regulatory inhibitor subunit PPP1R7-like protein [Frankliniella fusca]
MKSQEGQDYMVSIVNGDIKKTRYRKWLNGANLENHITLGPFTPFQVEHTLGDQLFAIIHDFTEKLPVDVHHYEGMTMPLFTHGVLIPEPLIEGLIGTREKHGVTLSREEAKEILSKYSEKTEILKKDKIEHFWLGQQSVSTVNFYGLKSIQAEPSDL